MAVAGETPDSIDGIGGVSSATLYSYSKSGYKNFGSKQNIGTPIRNCFFSCPLCLDMISEMRERVMFGGHSRNS